MSQVLALENLSHSLNILFAEDFDAPLEHAAEEATELEGNQKPLQPTPVFSAEQVEAARRLGYEEGKRDAEAEAKASAAALAVQAISRITEAMNRADAEAARIAEETADTFVRLLLDALLAVLPGLCARYSDAEIAAMVKAIVPPLRSEPRVKILIHPDQKIPVEKELLSLEKEFRQRIFVETDFSVPRGDARIAWQNGSAVRNTRQAIAALKEALLPLGLLSEVPSAAETEENATLEVVHA